MRRTTFQAHLVPSLMDEKASEPVVDAVVDWLTRSSTERLVTAVLMRVDHDLRGEQNRQRAAHVLAVLADAARGGI